MSSNIRNAMNSRMYDRGQEERGDKVQENRQEKPQESENEKGINPNPTDLASKGFYISCNEAPLSIRAIPSHSWPYSGSNNPPSWASHTGPIANSNLGYENDFRFTKAHLGRTCVSNAKLKHLEKREKYHFGNVDF